MEYGQTSPVIWHKQVSGTLQGTLFRYIFRILLQAYAVAGREDTENHKWGDIPWDSIFSGTSQDLNNGIFCEAKYRIAAGNNWTYSEDHRWGEYWDSLSSGTAANLSAVYFPNGHTGYGSGRQWNSSLKHRNEGTFWDIQSSGTASNLTSVFLMDVYKGWYRSDVLH